MENCLPLDSGTYSRQKETLPSFHLLWMEDCLGIVHNYMLKVAVVQHVYCIPVSLGNVGVTQNVRQDKGVT